MKKSTNKTVDLVTRLAEPIAAGLGLTLWDVRFEKEGAMWVLLIVIDKEGGVSVDDCEAVSRPLDAKLDEADPIEQSYCLEVSSAGIERELSRPWHFAACKGQQVTLRLIRPNKDGEREFIGKLLGYEEDTDLVSIETSSGTAGFSAADIANVRLYASF